MYVLRLYHRPERDKRVTTHLILVARAFGAKGVFVNGDISSISKSIKKVLESWGGHSYFILQEVKDPKKFVLEWKSKGGKVVHLTMYGINIIDIKNKLLQEQSPLLVIVGSEKVERWYYEKADYNVAIGNQPHSEVVALAIFLDRMYEGKELEFKFFDAKYIIIPQEKGKKVIRVE
ncbi:MAG: tRNA methyltransferase [Sulfolobaceae archaeon]